jgi:hypothetical protein
MAAVRALRPNRDRLRWANASGASVAAKTTKHRSNRTILFIQLSPYKHLHSPGISVYGRASFHCTLVFLQIVFRTPGTGRLMAISRKNRRFWPDYDEKILTGRAAPAYAFDARLSLAESSRREVIRQAREVKLKARRPFDLAARALA